MSEISVDLVLEEGYYVETNDHIYKIQDISDNEISAKRLDSGIRTYSPEEFSRILKFTKEITIRRQYD